MVKLSSNELDDLIDVILSDDKLINYVMKLIQQHISASDILQSSTSTNNNKDRRSVQSTLQILDKVILKAFDDVRIGDMVKNIVREQEQEHLLVKSSSRKSHSVLNKGEPLITQQPRKQEDRPIVSQHQQSNSMKIKGNDNHLVPVPVVSNNHHNNSSNGYLEIHKEVERQKLMRQQKEQQQQQQQQQQQEQQHSNKTEKSQSSIFYPQKQSVDTSILGNRDREISETRQVNRVQQPSIQLSSTLEIPQWNDNTTTVTIKSNNSSRSPSSLDGSSSEDVDQSHHHEDSNDRSADQISQSLVSGDDHDGDVDDEMKPNYSFSEPEQVSYQDPRRKVRQLNKQRAVSNAFVLDTSQQSNTQDIPNSTKQRPAPLQPVLSIEVDPVNNEEFSIGDSERNNNSFLSEPVTLSEASTVRMVITPVSTSMGVPDVEVQHGHDTDSISTYDEDTEGHQAAIMVEPPSGVELTSTQHHVEEMPVKLSFQEQRTRSGRNSPGKPNADGSTNKHHFEYSDEEESLHIESQQLRSLQPDQRKEEHDEEHDDEEEDLFRDHASDVIDSWERKVTERLQEEGDNYDDSNFHDEIEEDRPLSDHEHDDNGRQYLPTISQSQSRDISNKGIEPLRLSDQDMVCVDDLSPVMTSTSEMILTSPVAANPSITNSRYSQNPTNITQDDSNIYEDDYEMEDQEDQSGIAFKHVIPGRNPQDHQIDHDNFNYMRDLEDPNSPDPRPNQPLYFDQHRFDSEVDRINAGKPLKHVQFAPNIVSDTFYREKTSPSEKTTLFYSHHEEGLFCEAQSREYAKADAMGLSWIEYMNQRDDHDASMEDDAVDQEMDEVYSNDDEMEGDEEFVHDYHHYYHDNHDEVYRRKGIEFSDEMDDSGDAF